MPKFAKARCQSFMQHQDEGVIGMDGDKDEIIKLLMQPHPHHGDGDGDKSVCALFP